MDCDTAGYKQERYDEISNEMRSMLIKVEWKKGCIARNTPVVPFSGWMIDNLDFIAKNTPVFHIFGRMSDNEIRGHGLAEGCVDAEEFHVVKFPLAIACADAHANFWHLRDQGRRVACLARRYSSRPIRAPERFATWTATSRA